MVTAMPHWDLTPFFPTLDSAEYKSACAKAEADLAGLKEFFDQNNIDANEGSPFQADLTNQLLAKLNSTAAQLRVIRAYLSALITTDSDDEKALAAYSETDALTVAFSKLMTRFDAWAGRLHGELTGEAKTHEFLFQRARVIADHQMSPDQESLRADLATTGLQAWRKLHGNITSQLMVTVNLPDETIEMPMSAVRNLAFSPDTETRKAGYEAELAAWKTVEIPLAACLNGIKGEVNTLCDRRGWNSALEAALFENSIDQPTLDAMMTAMQESFPDFRRYLKAKAKALGNKELPFYDIFAPIGEESKEWTFEESEQFVEKSFRNYSDKLADFAIRAFRERWIDYGPRKGKRDGAYCSPFRDDVSRIMMNFKPSYKSVGTLAHELGHGYHNLCISGRPYLLRSTPSTLAETASIFCETIMKNAALAQGTDQENLSILEASVGGPCQVVVDICSRFKFEASVFEARKKRDLSPAEMCEFMLQAQRDTYGDGLDIGQLHPYMWAVKPHYYSEGSFYNFPYAFGLLFGLGLYRVYQQQPQGFHERYDDLLSSTGMADAPTLAKRFGFDLHDANFWRGSLDIVRSDIDRFVAAIG